MDDRINKVLSNPQLMAQIAAAVRGAEEQAPAPPPAQPVQLPVAENGSTDRALTLLSALAPFLKSRRREKLDAVTKALTVASVYKNAKNI